MSLKKTFTLKFFTRELARTAYRFRFLTSFLHGGFFEMLPKLHFTKHTFALQFLLQRPKRLIDIVVANLYLHWLSPPFGLRVLEISQGRAI